MDLPYITIYQFIGTMAYTDFRDTPLLDRGIGQAKTLGEKSYYNTYDLFLGTQ